MVQRKKRRECIGKYRIPSHSKDEIVRAIVAENPKGFPSLLTSTFEELIHEREKKETDHQCRSPGS